MELWIRSQNKLFIDKIDGLMIDEKNNGECDVCKGFITYGTYKSKERALEVLDDIQNKIKTLLYLKPKALFKPEDLISAKKYFEELNNLEFITCDKNFEIIPFSSNVVVYEMPKE